MMRHGNVLGLWMEAVTWNLMFLPFLFEAALCFLILKSLEHLCIREKHHDFARALIPYLYFTAAQRADPRSLPSDACGFSSGPMGGRVLFFSLSALKETTSVRCLDLGDQDRHFHFRWGCSRAGSVSAGASVQPWSLTTHRTGILHH